MIIEKSGIENIDIGVIRIESAAGTSDAVIAEYTIFDGEAGGIAYLDRTAVILSLTVLDCKPIQPGIFFRFMTLDVQENALSLKIDDCFGRAAFASQLDVVTSEIDFTVIGACVNSRGDDYDIFHICDFGGVDAGPDASFGCRFAQSIPGIIAAGTVDIDDTGGSGRVISLSNFNGIRDSIIIGVRLFGCNQAASAIETQCSEEHKSEIPSPS